MKRVFFFFFLVIGKNFSINLMMVYNLIYLDTLTSLHIIFYLQFKQSLSKGIIKGKKTIMITIPSKWLKWNMCRPLDLY